MNKKILKLVLVCFLFSLNLKAQTADFYYTFGNNKINLTKISGKYLAEFPNGFGTSNTMNPLSYPGVKLTDKTYIVLETASLSNYNSTYNVTPTYLTSDGQELNYTREILLKFKNTTSASTKASLISSKNLTLIKSTISYDMYEATGDALQISKSIYLTGQVEFCTPNFIARVDKLDHIPNDPYFNNQWYLHNTGQGTNDGKSTTVDADIDAPNPASNTVNISYKLNDVSSAYLMVLGSYGTSGTSNNYILDINSANTNIDISNYQNGFYTVALVCNGQIVDAKTLVKQ